jgi:hypothetical protein
MAWLAGLPPWDRPGSRSERQQTSLLTLGAGWSEVRVTHKTFD